MMLYSPFLMMTMATMMMSTLMTISSNNWLMIWLAMELNLISFIPMINSSNNFQETEASVKYLLVQAMGSSLLIVSSMSMWLSHQIMNEMNIVLLVALIIKIGMAPCHMWYPSVMTSIAWFPALILSTWQKLAPLSIMAFMLMKSSTMLPLLASLNALIGGVMGMNQSHLRTILAYSSITHMGWMLSLICMNMPIPTMMYFMTYALLVFPIFFTFMKLNSKTLSQMNSSTHMNKNQYMFLPVMFLSLGGLPPLTGFFPKWLTIYLISPSSFILLFILISGSLMNLYFYLNIIFSSMLSLNSVNMHWKSETKFFNMTTLFLSMICIPLIPMLML